MGEVNIKCERGARKEESDVCLWEGRILDPKPIRKGANAEKLRKRRESEEDLVQWPLLCKNEGKAHSGDSQTTKGTQGFQAGQKFTKGKQLEIIYVEIYKGFLITGKDPGEFRN